MGAGHATVLACLAASVVACSGDRIAGPGASTARTLVFCPASSPIWLAYQDDGGQWTQARPGANGSYQINIGSRGGVAYVRGDSVGFARLLEVEYATGPELEQQFQCNGSPAATKALAGTVAGLASGQSAAIAMGSAATWVDAPDSSYRLDGVADGPLDLVAIGTSGASNTPSRILIRRGVNLASGSRIPLVDLSSADVMPPEADQLTIGGLNGELVSAAVNFTTANGSAMPLTATFAETPGVAYSGVPAAMLARGDLHTFDIEAQDRAVYAFYHAGGARTVALGPSLSAPTTTVAATVPYVRPRLQLPMQPEYSSVLVADWYEQPSTGPIASIEVVMIATAGYAGGAGSSWTLEVPDLTAAGFQRSWGLQPNTGVSLQLSGFGGASISEILADPTDGLVYRTASFGSSASRLKVVRGRGGARFQLTTTPTRGQGW